MAEVADEKLRMRSSWPQGALCKNIRNLRSVIIRKGLFVGDGHHVENPHVQLCLWSRAEGS